VFGKGLLWTRDVLRTRSLSLIGISTVSNAGCYIGNYTNFLSPPMQLCHTHIGNKSLSPHLKLPEVGDNGGATRDAVVTAFLRLVNLQQMKRRTYSARYTVY
jgi:hypothetical protein